MNAWILFIGIAALSWVVQASLQAKYKKFSRVALPARLTGAEVARKMLNDNGLYDVQVTHVAGTLTDHYDPTKKTVNLSEGVYNSYSVMAAAVAAHECGHAVQHATAYGPLQLRSRLVPVVNLASKTMTWILLGGMLLLNVFPQLLLFGILLYACTTFFSLVTLPVEINASQRALAWLDRAALTDRETHPKAQSALKSAAYTYVVAALSSLATLFYYLSIYAGRRD